MNAHSDIEAASKQHADKGQVTRVDLLEDGKSYSVGVAWGNDPMKPRIMVDYSKEGFENSCLTAEQGRFTPSQRGVEAQNIGTIGKEGSDKSR